MSLKGCRARKVPRYEAVWSVAEDGSVAYPVEDGWMLMDDYELTAPSDE